MASLAHPSATASNYHLQSLPRICNLKMNPLSNTNYSRSLAAIALANHSAALNQLSALNSASSSLSSHSAAAVADLSGSVSGSGSGCGAGGDVRMPASALLMREAMDVSVTSSPLGSPGTSPWFAGANPGSGGYFSPDLRSVGGGGGGFQAGSMEIALKKLGECGRMGSDFHSALPHQQHSLSSVQQQQQQQQQQRLRSSDSNVTRFGSLQQQQQLHQEASRNDWAIHGQQQCTDANLSFASSMAAALVPSSGRGSLAARAVLLGGAGNMQRQQQESYSRGGNGDGDSLSARIMRAIGEGSTQQQQQQQQDLGGDESSMLQEMMGCGSYNVAPPSNAAQHFLSSGRPMAMPAMPMQGSMEADWTSLLMDAAAADVSVSLQASLPKPSPASLHFIPDSTFPDTKMLYHGGAGTGAGAGAGQPGGGGGGGGGGDGQLEDGAAFLDAASGKHAGGAMNFGAPALDPAMVQLQTELPGGGARSPLHSPSFGTKTTSLQNLGSSSSNTKGEAGARPDNLGLSSDAPRMWAPGPRKDGGIPKQPPGLARTMSVNSRGNSPGELEMEQCSSMSAMLESELPLSEKRFGKSGRRLSRTSSPSVSTMMDLASLEHGTGNSSASTSASERGDAEEKKNLGEPVPEASGSGLTMAGKGKAVVGGNGSEGAEVGGDDSSSSKLAVKENSGDSQGKKRKGRGSEDGPAGKTSVTSASTAAKDSKNEEVVDAATRAKRCKASASEPDAGRGKAGGVKLEKTASDNSVDSAGGPSTHASKPPEAPKPDYIHVRARRGQATDSHSLAERVRREKISERMKFLQDLVPGCSKVTGKAMMLDEIINYVQSLQRQVEYLSMKLASVNPRMDFGGVESLLSKEQSRGFGQGGQQQLMIGSEPITIPSSAYPQLHPQQQAIAMQQLAVTCGLDMRALGTQLDTVAGGLRRPLLSPASTSSITMAHSAHSARDPFEDSVSQVSAVWDGELHSVVQMGFAQNRLSALASPSLRGSLPPGNMKLER